MANTNRTLKYKIEGGSWTTDSTIPDHVTTVGEIQDYLRTSANVQFPGNAVINMNMEESVTTNEPLVTAAGQDVIFLTWQSNDKKGGSVVQSIILN